MISPSSISDLEIGQVIDFGTTVLTEEDIITFAKAYDPMPFHIDKKVAEKSHFKGLIASGPHLFHLFYNREWVPRFKHTVFAGKGITNWMLEKPVYANTNVHCNLHIKNIEHKPERGYSVVHWHFSFLDDKERILQFLDLIVLHKLE